MLNKEDAYFPQSEIRNPHSEMDESEIRIPKSEIGILSACP